jgi:hypothetical protein
MKKLLLITALLYALGTNAQDTITNGNFERWVSSGKPAPFDWEEPQGWTSSNELTEAIGAGVTQTQTQGSGSLQAKLKTIDVFGNAVPAILINGHFNFELDDTAKIPMIGGEPATVVKPYLYGMYNYTVTDTTDSAMVIVRYKKFNNSTQQTEAIAGGVKILPATGIGLVPFKVDIQTIASGIPDSVVVTIISGKNGNFKQGGELIVDYVTFENPNTATPIIPEKINKVIVYPNPATNNITLLTNDVLGYEIIDIAGKTILKGSTPNTETSMDVSLLANGVYFIKLNAPNPQVVRFIKQ